MVESKHQQLIMGRPMKVQGRIFTSMWIDEDSVFDVVVLKEEDEDSNEGQ